MRVHFKRLGNQVLQNFEGGCSQSGGGGLTDLEHFFRRGGLGKKEVRSIFQGGSNTLTPI